MGSIVLIAAIEQERLRVQGRRGVIIKKIFYPQVMRKYL
jgi:hypothetical protein